AGEAAVHRREIARSLVDLRVAVVVEAVAELVSARDALARWNAPAAAETLVDEPVAIVVDSVANLLQRDHILVRCPIAIFVDAVAGGVVRFARERRAVLEQAPLLADQDAAADACAYAARDAGRHKVVVGHAV